MRSDEILRHGRYPARNSKSYTRRLGINDIRTNHLFEQLLELEEKYASPQWHPWWVNVEFDAEFSKLWSLLVQFSIEFCKESGSIERIWPWKFRSWWIQKNVCWDWPNLACHYFHCQLFAHCVWGLGLQKRYLILERQGLNGGNKCQNSVVSSHLEHRHPCLPLRQRNILAHHTLASWDRAHWAVENQASQQSGHYWFFSVLFDQRYRYIWAESNQRLWWAGDVIHVLGMHAYTDWIYHLFVLVRWAQKRLLLLSEHSGWMHIHLRLHQYDAVIIYKLSPAKCWAYARKGPLLQIFEHDHRWPLQFHNHDADYAQNQLLQGRHNLRNLSVSEAHLQSRPDQRHVRNRDASSCSRSSEIEARSNGKSQEHE